MCLVLVGRVGRVGGNEVVGRGEKGGRSEGSEE